MSLMIKELYIEMMIKYKSEIIACSGIVNYIISQMNWEPR